MTEKIRTPFFVRDKSFYKLVLGLVLPMTLQNVMQLLLNLMDTVMLGWIEGEHTETIISAANLANQPYFVYSLFLFGMVSGASVLISQYWGKNDIATINSITGIAVIAVFGGGGVFTAVCYIFTDGIMGLFTPDEMVIEQGVQYLKIILASYLVASLTTILCGVMRSTEQVGVALFTNTTAIFINIALNYVLIFGKLGFEAMGIRGAAIATLIARVIELLMVLVYVVFIDKKVRLSIPKMLRIRVLLIKDFIRYSLPVILNETFWGLGITFHSVVIGNLGPDAHSAYAVANIIERIGVLAALGFANASLIIIGKEIGAGRVKNAYPYAKTMLTLSFLFGILMSCVVFFIRGAVIDMFNVDAATKSAAMNIAFVMMLTVFAKSITTTGIVGVIRGGGDTVTAMICDFIPMWFFAIPLGAAAAYLIELPVWWVYACLMSDEFVKLAVVLLRVKSKKWIRNVTR